LWLDSTEGWLAVVDGATQYAMVERFRYEETKPYPGKASIIFWTNGPELKLGNDGEVGLSGGEEGQPPYYLEAELNSPLCRLGPAETCDMETEWFPTRAGSEFCCITDAGVLIKPVLVSRSEGGKINLSGSFGVFYSGRLVAHFYDQHGAALGSARVTDVNPTELISLEAEIHPDPKTTRLSLHLEDSNGVERGALQEVHVSTPENH